MLRITRVAESASQVTYKVEGKIVAEWVFELERECLAVLQEKRKVRLDVSAVTFIDRRGVAAMRRLAAEHVAIINCPEFIGELLRKGSER